MGDHGARQLTWLFRKRMFRWDAKAARYRVEMDPQLRQVLRELMQQFEELLTDPATPALRRLFPPAYSDPAHTEMSDEFRRLMQEDLVGRHVAECRLVLETATADTVSEEQLMAWIRAVNGLRLVLGTVLDVSEDDRPRPPSSPEESAYQWLSFLLDQAVEALSRQT